MRRRKVLSLSLLDNRRRHLYKASAGWFPFFFLVRQTAILGSRPQTVAEVLFNGAKAREKVRERERERNVYNYIKTETFHLLLTVQPDLTRVALVY
jgi:hypothetical protein